MHILANSTSLHLFTLFLIAFNRFFASLLRFDSLSAFTFLDCLRQHPLPLPLPSPSTSGFSLFRSMLLLLAAATSGRLLFRPCASCVRLFRYVSISSYAAAPIPRPPPLKPKQTLSFALSSSSSSKASALNWIPTGLEHVLRSLTPCSCSSGSRFQLCHNKLIRYALSTANRSIWASLPALSPSLLLLRTALCFLKALERRLNRILKAN